MLKVTQKELDALELLASRHPVKRIAKKLGISESTVRSRLHQICQRNNIVAQNPIVVLAATFIRDNEHAEII